ncbi:hypothetical protein PRIPAC_81821, partial [Pristionchus pacificus]|uniref:Uncharacterized protein n=1 Tax=Pristionchus pacificus TaxID=54126 RepID=A0A2A6CN07_PRIPA
MAIDTFSDLYAPMFLANEGIIYSNSSLSRWISAAVYWVVLHPSSRFIFFGRKRNLMYTILHATVLTATSVEIYFMQKSMESSENSMHSSLLWLKEEGKTSYFVMQTDSNLIYAYCRVLNYYKKVLHNYSVIVLVGYGLVITTVEMLIEIVKEVKKGMHWTCRETQRYQRLALILQGTLPTLGYLIPAIIFACLQFAPMLVMVRDDFEQI